MQNRLNDYLKDIIWHYQLTLPTIEHRPMYERTPFDVRRHNTVLNLQNDCF